MAGVRVCLPRFDRIYQLVKGRDRVSGTATPFVNLFLETTTGLNVSVQQRDTIGHLTEGKTGA